MARIMGVSIPDTKHIWIGLKKLYGIGGSLSQKILLEAGFPFVKMAGQLTEVVISRLSALIESKYTVEGNLRRQTIENINRRIRIGSYRGMRHRAGLPVRGQRTRSNARTRKGKRKTVAGKKKAPAPK